MSHPIPHKTIIITGGSSGIGCECIRHIINLDNSVRICNISRNFPQEFSHYPHLTHYSCDLSDLDAVNDLLPKLTHFLTQIAPSGPILLINNSGFGSYGPLQDQNPTRQKNMLHVNIDAPVTLTLHLLPEIIKRSGNILNVSSLAAFFPTPWMSTYGASKAFLLNWSLGLRQDLKNTSVGVTTLCPGPTETQFSKNAGFGARDSFRQPVDFVVNAAIKGLQHNQAIVIPGWYFRLLACLRRIMPLSFQSKLAKHFVSRSRS